MDIQNSIVPLMRNLIKSLSSYFGLFKNEINPSNNDVTTLIQQINIDSNIIAQIQKIAGADFEIATGSKEREWLFDGDKDLENYHKNVPKALKIRTNPELETTIIDTYKSQLKNKDLIIYSSNLVFGLNKAVITILQSKNKFEPILFEGTNGVNYDIYPNDIIKKLIIWDKRYGIELNKVGEDFLEGSFINPPSDIPKLAQEMYEFCPDIVDQGCETIAALEQSIQDSNKFFFWWD